MPLRGTIPRHGQRDTALPQIVPAAASRRFAVAARRFAPDAMTLSSCFANAFGALLPRRPQCRRHESLQDRGRYLVDGHWTLHGALARLARRDRLLIRIWHVACVEMATATRTTE